jgi:hypothetical protein
MINSEEEVTQEQDCVIEERRRGRECKGREGREHTC